MVPLLDFYGPTVGLTKPYRYNVVGLGLPTVERVQLWYKSPDDKAWQFGHAKNVPTRTSPATVADDMRRFILGEISHSEYNDLLPN